MALHNLHFVAVSDMSTSDPDGFGAPWGQPGDGNHLMGDTIVIDLGAAMRSLPIDDTNAGLEDDVPAQQLLAEDRTYNGVSYAAGTGLEAEYRITVTDGVNSYSMFAISIEGLSNHVIGFVFEDPPPPYGTTLTVTGHSDYPWISYTDATPACFTPGARIAAPGGPRAIETIAPGDLVETLDHGPRPVLWIARRRLDFRVHRANLKPVELNPGALGHGVPARALRLSPQHRVLLRGPEGEALAPVRAFLGLPGVRAVEEAASVVYIHLLFDRHEILFAEDAPMESFRPGPVALRGLPRAQRETLFALMPGMAEDPFAVLGPPARPLMKMKTARGLLRAGLAPA